VSSTETLNVVNAWASVAFAGGAVVKAILFAAAGVTVIAVLVTVKPLSGERVSVAVSVQFVPVVMVTALKVATAELAVARVVPVRVHEEES
jgi:hypothetical protein